MVYRHPDSPLRRYQGHATQGSHEDHDRGAHPRHTILQVMEGFDHGEDKTSVRNDGQQPHTAIITCRTPCYHVPCQGENAKAWALPKEPIRQGQRTETFTGTAGWPTRMLPRAPSPPSTALRRTDPGIACKLPGQTCPPADCIGLER